MNSQTSFCIQHIHSHFDRYVNELMHLVRIPSCSFDGYDPKHVYDCAQAVVSLLSTSGYQNIRTIPANHSLGSEAPFIYAELGNNPQNPTILLYAHYDVQPPMRPEHWVTPAYEPVIRDGRLYGRGAADDKAGIILHAACAEALLAQYSHEALPVNVKVLLEGQEEVGSPGLEEFIAQNAELLAADAVIVADMANLDTGKPAITTSLRGMAALEVELSTLKSPLHSGLWGGPIPDPAMALCTMLSGLMVTGSGAGTNQIDIPELYQMVTPPTASEMQSYESIALSPQVFAEQAGLLAGAQLHLQLPTEATHNVAPNTALLLKLWRYPALTITAIQSGSRQNAGNVLMDSAWARVGLRLAPGMDYQKSIALLQQKLHSLAPSNMQVRITPEQGGANPWSCSTEHPVFASMHQALSTAFGTQAVYMGCGATIPFVGSLCETLGGIPALLVGVEDPHSKAHSENESVHLEDLKKAMIAQVLFLLQLKPKEQ
jgi:cysteinylglycine-S-conjugate dipeptidase